MGSGIIKNEELHNPPRPSLIREGVSPPDKGGWGVVRRFMLTWFYTLVSVIAISLVSLIGVFLLVVNREKLQKALLYLVSFAVGGLFGDAFLHILPEAFAETSSYLFTSVWILAGIFLFFVLEKFFRFRHCHDLGCEGHIKPVAIMNLIGDGAHNLLDGLIIGASFLVSPALGLATTLAVFFHEIPQEIGDFGVLLHSGIPIKKALMFNFLSASLAVLGAVFALLVGQKSLLFNQIILPLASGGFIYIAGSDLIPELHQEMNRKRNLWQFLALILGIGIMALLLMMER